MPTISAGSSQTFTAGVKDQLFTLTANGGALGVVTGAVSASFGPGAERRAFGPFAVGQAITVTVQAGSVIVEYGDSTPEDEGTNTSTLTGSQVAAGAVGVAGVSSGGWLVGMGGEGSLRPPIETIDLRDWVGLSLNGSNDNSSILQAAIDQASFGSRASLGYGASYRLALPAGRIAFSTSLNIKQNSWIEGVFGASGGTELWWFGADGQDALVNTAGTELSLCRLANFRIEDKRTAPTSGRGISFKDFNNGVSLNRLQVMHFPLEQVYIGADSGQAGDCTDIDDLWLVSNKSTAKGLLLERLDNAISVRNIKSDLVTTPANDGYVLRIMNVTNDNTAIEIDGIKHESNNRCPTISLPVTTRGNLSIRNIIQRNPQGGAAGAGDVVQVGALAGGSAYAPDGTALGFTTGAASETGGRVTFENVTGINHSDWTGATGAAVLRGLGTSQAVYGAVQRAYLGLSGRFVRSIAGNSIPNGAVFGNVGDEYKRLDATATTCAHWVKQQGSATNTGWAPVTPETQSPAFSATLAQNLQSGNRIVVGALTGNITMSSPTNVPPQGVEISYDFTQDATGGRTLTWSALHKGAWPTASGTANQKQTVRGVSDGTNIVFSGASGWYS